jgi:hypothetical protein
MLQNALRIFSVFLSFTFVCVLTASAQFKPIIEPFNNNDHQWPFIGNGNGYTLEISNGHLSMDGNTTAIHTFKNAGITEEMDFALYTRLIFLNGSSQGWMGLRFAMNEEADKYIGFILNNDQGFMVVVNNGKKYDVLRESRSLVVKSYDYNSLSVIKSGTTYKFLINDKQVYEDKIKSFFGPLVGFITNTNMKMQVDEFQLYDSKKGRATISDNSILSSVQMSQSKDVSLLDILNDKVEATPEFKEFLSNFQQLPSPYYFTPENAQGTEVTNLPFTQKIFYGHVAATVRNKTMYAMGKLGECGEGYSLLMMNRYFINRQDVSRFFVVAFNKKGEQTGEKEIGSMTKENGEFFNVIEFKTYRDGNVINAEATEIYHNGHREKKNTRFNATLCNL